MPGKELEIELDITVRDGIPAELGVSEEDCALAVAGAIEVYMEALDGNGAEETPDMTAWPVSISGRTFCIGEVATVGLVTG